MFFHSFYCHTHTMKLSGLEFLIFLVLHFTSKQCCQVKIVQNHGHWWFFVKKWQFITTTPVLLHFYVVMNWPKIPKWQFWPNFCHQWPSKITDLVINHHTWQHCMYLMLKIYDDRRKARLKLDWHELILWFRLLKLGPERYSSKEAPNPLRPSASSTQILKNKKWSFSVF